MLHWPLNPVSFNHYTKDELRDLIIKEEKKIIKGLGWKSAGTTILLMFGITNI